MIAVNHLPRALHHYQAELKDCLPCLTTWRCTNAEAAGSPAGRLTRGFRTIKALRALDDDLLRLWPIFGRHEASLAALWRRDGTRWWQVVHDPVPLDDDASDERWLSMWATLARRDGGVQYLVHSAHALDLMTAAGVPEQRLHLLPHPVLTTTTSPQARETSKPIIACLGTYKPARDLTLLAALPAALGAEFQFRLVGRGWPALHGWDRTPYHVPEAEFDQTIATASVVLVPYIRFFQSGVMVRALELGVPCVAPRNAFTEAVAGPACQGLLADGPDIEVWVNSIRHAASARAAWAARLDTYQSLATRAYADWWATIT